MPGFIWVRPLLLYWFRSRKDLFRETSAKLDQRAMKTREILESFWKDQPLDDLLDNKSVQKIVQSLLSWDRMS
jgi:hypothetical protein